MINLCDINKYYSDSSLSTNSKRLPKPTEDIVIAGSVFDSETITFPNSCGLDQISSIKITFLKPNQVLTIQGDGNLTDPSNPRQPSNSEIEQIRKNNPQRVTHGWYTINPKYTIGTVSTNSELKLENIGLNSNTLLAPILTVERSCLADNTISMRSTWIENSLIYSCTVNTDRCSFISSKADSMTFVNAALRTESCSFAESVFQINNSLQSTSTTFIDCSFTLNRDCGAGFGDCRFHSVSIVSSNTGTPLSFGNTEDEKLNVNAQNVNFSNSISKNSNITSQIFNSSSLSMSGSNIVANSGDFINIINTRGSIQFNDIVAFNVTNISGSFNILNRGPIHQSLLINSERSVASLKSGTIHRGINDGIINAEYIVLGPGFQNNISGSIISSQCIFSGAINRGFADSAILTDTAINSGRINNAIFYKNSFNANGYVASGIFYDNTYNTGTHKCDDGSSVYTFKEKSFNTMSTDCDNALLNFYDMSLNKSSNLYIANFYDRSYADNELIILKQATFNDRSKFDTILINQGAISGLTIDLNHHAEGKELIIQGVDNFEININNNAKIDTINTSALNNKQYKITVENSGRISRILSDSYLPEIFFYDKSFCGGGQVKATLNDESKAVGDIDMLIMKDNSYADCSSIYILKAQDNASITTKKIHSSGLIEGPGVNFYGDDLSFSSLVFDNGRNNAILKGIINSRVIFISDSINNGSINNVSNVIFQDSHNVGSIDNMSTAYFFGSSVNSGYVQLGYFYAGSSNFGVVKSGIFHPSVTATGIVEFYSTDSDLMDD